MAGLIASNSWRLTVKEEDRSSTVRGDASNVGAMVIRAPRGPVEPVKIYKGQEQRILDIFGTPSSDYPDIYEAIQYNYQDDIWISAPYDDTAVLGGVLVSESGSSALDSGIDPDSLTDYSFNSDNEYFVLAAKSPCADFLGVKITYNENNQQFTVNLYKKDGASWDLLDTYTVSPIEGTKDGFGKNIFVEEVFSDNDFVQAYANASADLTGSASGFTDDSAVVAFDQGSRGSAITITELTTGWNYFQKLHKYPADLFMDPTAVDGVQDLFDTLRNTYQKYSFYIVALPGSENASTAITTRQGYVNNAGLAYYWNRGKVRDVYNNTSFWTSLIGKIGANLAAMGDIYNGGAPAWIQENGHGGQLGGGILELEYDPTESELESLDEAGVNAIAFYPNYGYMITSHRTAQSPNSLSDSSWIAHRRLFDYIISTILNQVLIYQIVKLNDELHRRLAVSKGTTIMDPILASGLLSNYAIQCDRNNNTDSVLAARKFVYTLALKVTPYSEEVVLEFINVGQNVEVNEVIV